MMIYDQPEMGDDAESLSDQAVDRLFAPLAAYRHLLVAVSGGVDSTVLLVLLWQWSKRHGAAPAISVAVVDHGLREASAREAKGVCQLAASLDCPADILVWRDEKPKNGIQAAARKARFDLLTAHASAIDADGIVLAHHCDDQSETLLMRLCAGSGLDGLAGMAVKTRRAGIDLLRPLLGVSKAALVKKATMMGLDWVEDPSNGHDHFTRVRFRKASAFLADAGLDAPRLSRLARRMNRARQALEERAGALWLDVAVVEAGLVHLKPSFFGLAEEWQIRLLMKACSVLAPDVPQRLERFEAMQERLLVSFIGKMPFDSTLSGCLVRLRAGQITFLPEPPRQRGRSEHGKGRDRGD